MPFLLQPFHVMLLVLSEFVRKEQEKRIEFLLLESQILRETIGGNRVLLTDADWPSRGKFLEDVNLSSFQSLLMLTQFYAGIENSSKNLNSVQIRVTSRGDRESIKKLSAWLFAWPGRTRAGATKGFRAS